MNPITGEKKIAIAGEEYILRYDWRALSEVVARHGDAPNMMNPEVIASVAAIGLARRYPEITAERIMELSPPLVPFAHAVQTAIQWAYFGAEKPGDVKKKNAPPKAGLWRRIKQRFAKA